MEKLIQAIILSDANEPVCFCCDYDKYNYKLQEYWMIQFLITINL